MQIGDIHKKSQKGLFTLCERGSLALTAIYFPDKLLEKSTLRAGTIFFAGAMGKNII